MPAVVHALNGLTPCDPGRASDWIQSESATLPDEAPFCRRVERPGRGIAPAEQPHVFARFHCGAEARSRRREGSGLGLSLSRAIRLAHGGDLVLVVSTAARTVLLLSLSGQVGLAASVPASHAAGLRAVMLAEAT